MKTLTREELRAEIGPALRRLRDRSGLTQERVATAMGLRQPAGTVTVRRIESAGSNPRSDNLFLYLTAVGSSFAALQRELFDDEDPTMGDLVQELKAVTSRLEKRQRRR